MFLRVKRTQSYAYVQLVENRWEEGRSRQRVLATLGRLEQLQESGSLGALLESGSRLVEGLTVLSEHRRREAPGPLRPGSERGTDLLPFEATTTLTQGDMPFSRCRTRGSAGAREVWSLMPTATRTALGSV